jgi:hypothetical protein
MFIIYLLNKLFLRIINFLKNNYKSLFFQKYFQKKKNFLKFSILINLKLSLF